jgi:SynChlorMet cassette radical SAM/SPASM protein ScmF
MNQCDFRESMSEEDESLNLPDGIPPLRTFYLYLSNSCNLACRHCWITPHFVGGQPDPGDVINVDRLQAAIDEAKTIGLAAVKLTGGEPMLHPGFRKIVDFVSAEDLTMTMETNGTLLSAEMARYLKDETSMEFVSVSIDGPRADIHDGLRGVDGAFERVLRGLDHLIRAGYDNVQVIMAVHHGNLESIEELVCLAAQHGAASVKFNPVTGCGRGTNMEQQGETLDFGERMALDTFIFKQLRPRLHAQGVNIDLILNTPPALMPISEILRRGDAVGDCGVLSILGILGSGEIALCGTGRNVPELMYGTLGTDSIRDIWLHHPTILELRRVLNDTENYPGICGRCRLAKHCRTGCVAKNFLDGGQLVKPDSMCVTAQEHGLFPETRIK